MWTADDYLAHHGILGQRWGKRNGPPYPLGNSEHSYSERKSGWSKSLKKSQFINYSYSDNVKDWGKTKDNNVLYVTGMSGSGKSTISRAMSNLNTNVIHLDLYLEKHDGQDDYLDPDFEKYLQMKNFKKNMLSNTSIERKERWKYIDEFAEKHIVEFSKEQFSKGKRVLVEGVQLSDDTMYPNKSFFKDKSVIITNTPALISVYRANKRDGKTLTIQDIKERIEWNNYLKKKFKEIGKDQFKNGRYFVNKESSLKVY